MCGIFGVATYENNKYSFDCAEKALDTLVHRGPDQRGCYATPRAYVGHRRLSIIDLSERGRQPFVDNAADIVVAVNGEVYNYKELFREMGCVPYSSSDSEVILHGYKKWGIQKLLSKMEGMFAFVVYDMHKQKIWLARDRVGVKPLYFGEINGEFVWASELKAIDEYFREVGGLSYDETALYDALTYRYIPAPKTKYKNVFKVRPAEFVCIDIDSGRIKKKRYWEPLAHEKDLEADGSNVRKSLIDSVWSQVVSDVSYGLFLSGGVDSTVLLSIIASEQGVLPSTYSLGVGKGADNELGLASETARHYNVKNFSSNVEELCIDEQWIDWLMDTFDEPFGDSSAFPTFLLSRLASTHEKVVLSGDGGDELFSGYRWHAKQAVWEDLNAPAACSAALIAKQAIGNERLARGRDRFYNKLIKGVFYFSCQDPLEVYNYNLGGLLPDERRAYRGVLEIDEEYDDLWFFRDNYDPSLPRPLRYQLLDFKSFLPELVLTKLDRTSMLVGLEARVPFLDTNVVESAFRAALYAQTPGRKDRLLEQFGSQLPENIVSQPKRGFGMSLSFDKNRSGRSKTLIEKTLQRFI